MIITDSYVISVPADKFKNDPPLVVDTDGPFSALGRVEQLKPIARERSQVFNLSGEMDAVQFRQSALLDILRQLSGTRLIEDFFRFLIGERLNHARIIPAR